jgi:hypothetical protein
MSFSLLSPASWGRIAAAATQTHHTQTLGCEGSLPVFLLCGGANPNFEQRRLTREQAHGSGAVREAGMTHTPVGSERRARPELWERYTHPVSGS